MTHATNTITIQRPIGEVFAYVANGNNDPQWRASILETQLQSEQDGVGAIYHQVVAGPKMRPRVPFDYRVTEYKPPYRRGFQYIVGVARPVGLFELTENGPDATTVTYTLECEVSGFKRFFGGMIQSWMQEDVQQLEKLKTLLESDAS